MAIKTTVVFLVGLAFGLVHVSEAQQSKKVPRIGYVSSGDPSTEPRLEAFRRGLRDLGYVEGKPDRVPSIVNELVQLKVDVLVVVIFSSIRAAKEATKTIPLSSWIPVATGLIDSLVTILSGLRRGISAWEEVV
jgi:putative tryptophan/tyrosine transport system substrate-binding protein